SANDTGPEPGVSKSSRKATFSGRASVTKSVSASIGPTAGLMTVIWYSTNAPGIALGLLNPLTGSQATALALTTVNGSIQVFVHTHATALSSGMAMVRLAPVPVTGTALESLALVQANAFA